MSKKLILNIGPKYYYSKLANSILPRGIPIVCHQSLLPLLFEEFVHSHIALERCF